jgi:hypothetical protein
MKDISNKTLGIFLVIYIVAIAAQMFFAVNHPSIITGKASDTAKISLVIESPAAPIPPPPPSGGETVIPGKCIPLWMCTNWGDCTVGGIQYRTCTDTRNCHTLENKPPENRTCTYTPTCFDGILNGYETDIDCGGQFCSPCEDGKKCKISRDCINECNSTIEICYSPPGIPPLLITPAPITMWDRLKLYIRILMISIALLLLIILYPLFVEKEKLRLIYMNKHTSLWKYKKYKLKIFKILNKKKLKSSLEVSKGKRHKNNIINISSTLDRLRYSFGAAIKGLNPFAVLPALFALKIKLKRKLIQNGYYD